MIARIVAWLLSIVKSPADAKNDGYWGGVFTHALNLLRRTGANAAAFLRR